MTLKMDFLISPEKPVPATKITRSWKLMTTAALELRPLMAGSHW